MDKQKLAPWLAIVAITLMLCGTYLVATLSRVPSVSAAPLQTESDLTACENTVQYWKSQVDGQIDGQTAGYNAQAQLAEAQREIAALRQQNQAYQQALLRLQLQVRTARTLQQLQDGIRTIFGR